jgi:hypothetical protein
VEIKRRISVSSVALTVQRVPNWVLNLQVCKKWQYTVWCAVTRLSTRSVAPYNQLTRYKEQIAPKFCSTSTQHMTLHTIIPWFSSTRKISGMLWNILMLWSHRNEKHLFWKNTLLNWHGICVYYVKVLVSMVLYLRYCYSHKNNLHWNLSIPLHTLSNLEVSPEVTLWTYFL